MAKRSGTMQFGGAIVWFGASYAVAIAGYLALNAAAGRMLGPSAFGYFVAALTLAAVAGQIGLLGVHRSGLREASRLQRDDVERLAALRRGVRAVSTVSLPLAGVISGLVTWVLAQDQPVRERAVLAVSVAALVVLSGLQKLWANYLRGFGMVRFASLLEGRSGGAFVAIMQAALIALVWLLAPSWGLAGALAAVVLGYAVPVALASRSVRQQWEHATSPTHVWRDLREVAGRDWKFASTQVATMLNASLEIWIAGFLLTSHDTSMFGAAQRLAALVLLPMTALQVVFAPMVARLTATGPHDELESMLRTGATLATVTSAILWLPLFVTPEFVLGLVFGPRFDAAAVPLMLLATAALNSSVAGLAGLTLSMAHREGVTALVQWSALVARLVLGIAVAVLWGPVALAATAAVVSTIMYYAMWSRTRKDVGVNTALTFSPDVSLVRRPTGVAE